MNVWHPIETAPKDGRAILAAFPDTGYVLAVRWHSQWQEWVLHGCLVSTESYGEPDKFQRLPEFPA